MLLHAIQEHFGYHLRRRWNGSPPNSSLQPINVYELVTFYPMFQQKPVGKYHLQVCRTLSCALGGSHKLHEHLCKSLAWIRMRTGRKRPRTESSRSNL